MIELAFVLSDFISHPLEFCVTSNEIDFPESLKTGETIAAQVDEPARTFRDRKTEQRVDERRRRNDPQHPSPSMFATDSRQPSV